MGWAAAARPAQGGPLLPAAHLALGVSATAPPPTPFRRVARPQEVFKKELSLPAVSFGVFTEPQGALEVLQSVVIKGRAGGFSDNPHFCAPRQHRAAHAPRRALHKDRWLAHGPAFRLIRVSRALHPVRGRRGPERHPNHERRRQGPRRSQHRDGILQGARSTAPRHASSSSIVSLVLLTTVHSSDLFCARQVYEDDPTKLSVTFDRVALEGLGGGGGGGGGASQREERRLATPATVDQWLLLMMPDLHVTRSSLGSYALLTRHAAPAAAAAGGG